jgi:hypothetical protein
MRNDYAGVAVALVAVGVALGFTVTWIAGVLMIAAGLMFGVAAARG